MWTKPGRNRSSRFIRHFVHLLKRLEVDFGQVIIVHRHHVRDLRAFSLRDVSKKMEREQGKMHEEGDRREAKQARRREAEAAEDEARRSKRRIRSRIRMWWKAIASRGV